MGLPDSMTAAALISLTVRGPSLALLWSPRERRTNHRPVVRDPERAAHMIFDGNPKPVATSLLAALHGGQQSTEGDRFRHCLFIPERSGSGNARSSCKKSGQQKNANVSRNDLALAA